MSTNISAPVTFARDAYQLAMVELLKAGTLPGNLPTRVAWLASLAAVPAEVVLFTHQDLSEASKATARINIGADALMVPGVPMVGQVYRLKLGDTIRSLVPLASGGWFDGVAGPENYTAMMTKDGDDIWTIMDLSSATTWASIGAAFYPVGLDWIRTGGFDNRNPDVGYADMQSPVIVYSPATTRCWILVGATTAPLELSPETAASIAAALGYIPANDSAVMKLTGIQTAAGAKTFSGQMTLNGQTAASGSSAMTRDLVDSRISEWHQWNLGYCGWYYVSGGGAVGYSGLNAPSGYWRPDAYNGPAASVMRFGSTGDNKTQFTKFGDNGGTVRFSDRTVRAVVEFVVPPSYITGDGVVRFWSSEAFNFTGTNPTQKGFGFKLTAFLSPNLFFQLQLQVHNGATLVSSLPFSTVAVDVLHRLEMVITGGVLSAWLDGSQLTLSAGSVLTLSGGPTTDVTEPNGCAFVSSVSGASSRAMATFIRIMSLVQ